MAAALVGTVLVIASACVFNNCIDRNIDKNMSRTKQRALVIKSIPLPNALVFGSVLGIIGFTLLAVYTNWLVVAAIIVGFIDYVVLYGYAKRHSVHGTLVGAISGATPILAGYLAATGAWDAGATIVFLIMVVWQMPHFYGISMYRYEEYKKASLPVMSVSKGMRATKLQTVFYIALFAAVVGLLTVYDYTGYTYFVVTVGLALVWFYRAVSTMGMKDDKLWGRKVFLFSLSVLLVTCVMMSIGTRLP